MKSSFVVMETAALDELDNKSIILRGVVTHDSLGNLLCDDYQREAQPLSSVGKLVEAFSNSQSVPDIDLGMRGGRFKETKDGVFELRDPIYIVDGLQRVSAAMHTLNTKPDAKFRLGATLHFNTTKAWERERFHVLNSSRLKVSPNILLRNMRDDSKAMAMLHSLSKDKGFVLEGRVSWNQKMLRSDLTTALMLAKLTGLLHSHKVRARRSSVNELVPALDQTVDVIGVQALRKNVATYFELIDECWGIRRVQYREGAVYMRGAFLQVMARLLSDHTDFWKNDDKLLFIEAPLRRKIAQFPVNDPSVSNLAGSGGKSREILYHLLREHINSGKRTKRLTSRTGVVSGFADDIEDAQLVEA